eukprot:13908082-Alexandrium_andersonii.AAC.1
MQQRAACLGDPRRQHFQIAPLHKLLARQRRGARHDALIQTAWVVRLMKDLLPNVLVQAWLDE